jgi:hypothetical protein
LAFVLANVGDGGERGDGAGYGGGVDRHAQSVYAERGCVAAGRGRRVGR